MNAIRISYFLMVWVVLACLAAGCGITVPHEVQPQSRSLDGVKLISPEITDGYDPTTYVQDQYTLDHERRLLLRFDGMKSSTDSIQAGGPNKILLLISLASAVSATEAQKVLSVCPITKNWMMLATWNHAAPFGDSSQWQNPGGDYDSKGCVKAGEREGQTLKFDVTQWFLNYLQARRVNYGLILVSDQSVVVLGENSGALSPRFIWNQ
jgi:hypothetical protein